VALVALVQVAVAVAVVQVDLAAAHLQVLRPEVVQAAVAQVQLVDVAKLPELLVRAANLQRVASQSEQSVKSSTT
jgi:hypothetical protein